MTTRLWILASLVVSCGPRGDGATQTSRTPVADAPAANAPAPTSPLVDELNLDFERQQDGAPTGWSRNSRSYTVEVTDEGAHSGDRALRMTYTGGDGFGLAGRELPVERFRGKRVTLSGYLRCEGVSRGYAGLWMRVDGDERGIAFDNMDGRGVTGTQPWKRYEIVLDVAPEAKAVVFGALLTGDGAAWVDTLRIDIGDIPAKRVVPFDGTVVDDAGKPVAGALVALVAANRKEPVATAVSGDRGEFHISAEAGAYAITATAAKQTAAYVTSREYRRGAKGLRVAMVGDARTHAGTLRDELGAPIAGALVGAYRFSQDVGDIWFTRTAADGSFSLALTPADKVVAFVAEPGLTATEVELDGRKDQRVELVATRRGPAPAEVVRWIGKAAIRIKTAAPGAGLADIAPLARMIGKARVVALGEATHGTREFFQLKHRVLELLVEKRGFTAFAIEANFSESLAINDYVLRGQGDARAALAGIHFWTWNTEEVLALIEWMRRYNSDSSHTRKVSFYGFDMQFGAVAARKLLVYLTGVDPEYAKSVAERLTAMQSESALRDKPGTFAATIDELGHHLDRSKRAYAASKGKRAWQIARQHARVLAQQQRMNSATGRDRFEARDAGMAENIRWIASIEPKVLVWAHNGHVSRSGFSGFKTMGVHLAKELGRDYMVFGFGFDRGSFQAMRRGRGLAEITVGPSPEDTIGATFARAGCSLCVIDLRAIPRRSKVRAWFDQPRRAREVGAMYTSEENMLQRFELPAAYDAYIFVEQTTRARPIGKHRN